MRMNAKSRTSVFFVPLLVSVVLLVGLFALFATSQAAAQEGQWTDISANLMAVADPCNNTETGGLTDLFFVTPLEGWVTSGCSDDHGEVYHTSDGGQTWDVQRTEWRNTAIHMRDAQNGYVGAKNGWLYATTDGATWTTVDRGLNFDVLDIECPPTGDRCYESILGDVCALEGITWGEVITACQTVGSGANVSTLSAPLFDGEMWAASDKIWHYLDGVWHDDQSGFPSGEYLNGLDMADSSHGWAVGAAGSILHTADGQHWTAQTNPDAQGRALYAVQALDADEAWAVGAGGLILHTTDGGQTWSIEAAGLTANRLDAVHFPSHSVGYAIGANGTLLKYTGPSQASASASKVALPPRLVVETDTATGEPQSVLQQRYLLFFRYTDPDQPALDVRIGDTLPDELTFQQEMHAPEGVTFQQQGQRLTWQATSLPENQVMQAMVYAAFDTVPNGPVTNTATFDAGAWHFERSVATWPPLFPPLLTTPSRNGEICTAGQTGGVQIQGMAQSDVDVFVRLYENGTEAITVPVGSSGFFSTTYSSANIGIVDPVTLTAKVCLQSTPTHCSAAGDPLRLDPLPAGGFWCPRRSRWLVSEGRYQGIYRFVDSNGEFATQDWVIHGAHHFPASTIELYVPPDCSTTPEVWVMADNQHIAPSAASQPPIYRFDIPPAPDSVEFWYSCAGQEHSSTGDLHLIDPDGYIFDVTQGFDPQNPTLHAVSGVTVTCMISMPTWGGWVPWPAQLYDNQQNPQVTGPDGYFAFFTPPGKYYLQVEGIPGYQAWRSPVVEVVSQIVHVNVPYTPWPPGSASRVMLTPQGPDPAVITVPPGSAVEWVAQANLALPVEQQAALAENPIWRPLSERDPVSDIRGFDGGLLAPGQVYRRRFTALGIYPYSDGAGHKGQVVVRHLVFLPLVQQ